MVSWCGDVGKNITITTQSIHPWNHVELIFSIFQLKDMPKVSKNGWFGIHILHTMYTYICIEYKHIFSIFFCHFLCSCGWYQSILGCFFSSDHRWSVTISGSAVPSRLEASIIPTSRRSEMTMMRVLFLGFTDWGPQKTKAKGCQRLLIQTRLLMPCFRFFLWSYVSSIYSILDRRLWKRHWNFQTSRGVNVISRDSKPRCQSGTIASEHIIWYCKFINVYLGACTSIWRIQALAFVT